MRRFQHMMVLGLLLVGLTAGCNNPVSEPIVDRGLELHLRPFALIARPDGEPPKLNTIVSQGLNIYVTSEQGEVYEVTGGTTRLAFDFAAAWPAATGRTLASEANNPHGGLRGIAFSPSFETDQRVYTSAMEVRPANPLLHHYISDVEEPIFADSVVSEWTLVDGQLDPSGYRELFRVGVPALDHPVKDLAFGPDGYLYIGHGDGSIRSQLTGGGMDNDARGKILRINPFTPSNGLPYTIPADNPFVGDPNMIDEAWTIGHRNPHTLFFASDGGLLVGEPGRDNIEEVNLITKGRNYGWPEREGTFVQLDEGGLLLGVAPLPLDDARFGYTYPAAQVGHRGVAGSGFVGQAIVGGFVMENGSPIDGEYFFADFGVEGDIYHSSYVDLRAAVTLGEPLSLTQAPVARANIFFDHDSNPATPALARTSMVDVVNDAPTWTGLPRSDTRFGRGPFGEMYLSSKRNGLVYLVTSSLPGGPGGFVSE